MLHASYSRTCSNPVTVAAMIRVNGLDMVLRGGFAPLNVVRQAVRTASARDLTDYRRILAGRRRGSASWRGLKMARAHGVAALYALDGPPFATRLVAALIDAWRDSIDEGTIARRHGWDVALKLRGKSRDQIESLAFVMAVDLRALSDALALGEAPEARTRRGTYFTSRRVMKRACRLFGVSRDDIVGPARTRRIAMARHFYCYWMKRLTSMSFPELGRRLGGRDHTTVLNSVRVWPSMRNLSREMIRTRKPPQPSTVVHGTTASTFSPKGRREGCAA